MTEHNFNSILFGNSQIREATDQEREKIIELISTCPISVFQVLNKALNAQGFCISISALGDPWGRTS